MFEQVALLMDSSDIASLFNGCDQNSSFVASTLSFRKYLSAKVFEHSSLVILYLFSLIVTFNCYRTYPSLIFELLRAFVVAESFVQKEMCW
jgi:hypothetical protein